MKRFIVGSIWDRTNRNGINNNFDYLFKGLEVSNALNEKTDETLLKANEVLLDAERINSENIDVQRQLDQVIIESGTSDAEVIQARGQYNNLRERLDSAPVYLEEFGAVGDGITDDTLAIQEAIDYASLNNKTLSAVYNKVYAVKRLFLKSNFYKFGNISFVSLEDSGNNYTITCEDDVVIDEIRVDLLSGYSNERIVKISNRNSVGKIKITASSQYGNVNDLQDAAVVVSGSNTKIGEIDIKNFDNAVTVFDCTNTIINLIRVKSYKRAVYVRKSKDVLIHTIIVDTKSPEAGWVAGENSLLIEESENLTFPFLDLADAAEHAIRLGGVREGLYKQENFYFGTVITRRSQGCGFKVFSGAIETTAKLIKHIHIDNLTVIDACYKMPGIVNRDGLYLNNARDIRIHSYTCINEKETTSSNHGIYITGTDDVSINNTDIRNTKSKSIFIDKTDGRVNSVYFDNVNIKGAGEESIDIDMFGEVVRDIIFRNLFISKGSTSHYAIVFYGTAIYQPLLFDGYVEVSKSLGSLKTNFTNDVFVNKIVDIIGVT